MTALLSIGELATQTGLPVRTIRFYSDAGVVPEAERSRPGTGSTARTRSRGSGSCAPCAISAWTSRRSGACWSARSAWPTWPPRTRRRSTRRSASCGCRRPCSGRSPEEALTPRRCSACTSWPNCPTTSASGSSPSSWRRRSTAWTWSRASRRGCARPRPSCPTTRRPSRSTPGSSSPSWSRTRVQGLDPAHVRAALGGARRRRVDGAAAGLAGRGDAGRRTRGCRARGGHRPGLARGGRGRRRDPAGVRRRGADRAALADRFATGTDARAERYWQLLAIINGWPPVPTTVPAWEWLIAALRA